MHSFIQKPNQGTLSTNNVCIRHQAGIETTEYKVRPGSDSANICWELSCVRHYDMLPLISLRDIMQGGRVSKNTIGKLNKDLEKTTEVGKMEITGDLWENVFSSQEWGWVGKSEEREGYECGGKFYMHTGVEQKRVAGSSTDFCR